MSAAPKMTIIDLADACVPTLSHSEAKRIAFQQFHKLRALDWRVYVLESMEAAKLRPLFQEAARGPRLPGILPEPAPQVFLFDKWRVRVVLIEGAPWFVAKDVAEALGYPRFDSNHIGHIPENWKGTNPIRTPGGEQTMLVLSLPGLFFFLNRSDKPAALPFQEWVNGEVLVSIHQTGEYKAPAKSSGARHPEKRLPAGNQLHEIRLMAEKNLITSADVRRLLGLDSASSASAFSPPPEEPIADPETGGKALAGILDKFEAKPAGLPTETMGRIMKIHDAPLLFPVGAEQ